MICPLELDFKEIKVVKEGFPPIPRTKYTSNDTFHHGERLPAGYCMQQNGLTVT